MMVDETMREDTFEKGEVVVSTRKKANSCCRDLCKEFGPKGVILKRDDDVGSNLEMYRVQWGAAWQNCWVECLTLDVNHPKTGEKCSACGYRFDVSYLERKLDGRLYCKDCAAKYFKHCFSCGKEFERDAMSRVDGPYAKGGACVEDGNRFFCPDCAAKFLTKCDRCGENAVAKECTRIGIAVYCPSCAKAGVFMCDRCGEMKLKDDMTHVDDLKVCTACKEFYKECWICGAVHDIDAMEPYEVTGRVCQECISKGFVSSCDDCGMYYNKDMFEEYKGKTLCIQCTESALSSAVKHQITDDDVYKAFPDLVERIKRVYDRSAWNRSADARYALKTMDDLFAHTKVKIDRETLTYSDDYGKGKKLTDLKSERNVHFKDLSSGGQADVKRLVDTIFNNVSDVKALYAEMQEAITKVVISIKIRWYKEALNPAMLRVTSGAEGDYPMQADSKFAFRITKDPVAILAKTTSQCWEYKSCEKAVRGEYGKGAFYDIANSNLVCYIIDRTSKDLPVARVMIRWCLTDDGKVDFGIEKKWYFCTVHPDGATNFMGMGTAEKAMSMEKKILDSNVNLRKATIELLSIFQAKGFIKDYNRCKTPYVYGGYSDTSSAGRTRITYKDRDYQD